jgi:hypothetical protein
MTRLKMTAPRIKKNEAADTTAESPSQGKPSEDRFRLQVDQQIKSTYATLEAAEAAATAIKKSHPVVHVGVYDRVEGVNKIIELPKT